MSFISSWFHHFPAHKLLAFLRDNPNSYDAYTFDSLITYLAENHSRTALRSLAAELHRLVQNELKKTEIDSCLYRGFFDHTLEQYNTIIRRIPQQYLGSFLVLASQENNGYLREQAAKKWADFRDPTAIRFLIDRLSDWVSPVRKAAWNTLKLYLAPEYHAYFLERIHRIDLLSRKANQESNKYGEELMSYIFSQPLTPENAQQCEKLGAKRWTIYLRNMAESSLKIDTYFLNVMKSDRLPTVRSLAIRVLDRLSATERDSLLEELLHDTAQPVRSAAFYYAAQNRDRDGYEQLFYTAASDCSPSLREAARFYLRDKETDWRQYYRLRIDTENLVDSLVKKEALRQMLGDLGGFAEFANVEDLPLLEHLLKMEYGRVQAIVLRGICKIASQRSKEIAQTMLTHRNGKIRQICVDILSENPTRETKELARNAAQQKTASQRITALKLLESIGGWSVVPDLLLSQRDSDLCVQKAGSDLLDRWMLKCSTRTWFFPNEDDKRRLLEAIRILRPAQADIFCNDKIKTILFYFGIREH